MNEPRSSEKPELILWVLLALAAVVGLFGRLWDLGASPLAVDEYFVARSVRNIIEHGFPVFDCGGFYTRGLIHQYLSAGAQLLGASPEVAVRAVSLVANLATVPALFLLGTKFGGRKLGLIVCTIFLASIWEIEYSRFGRMYAPFQMAFTWYLWFLLAAREGRASAYMACVAISFISLAVYEGAALLLVLNFLPLLERRITGAVPWMVSLIAVALGLAYLSNDFRNFGADNSIPADYTGPGPGEGTWALPIDQPQVLLTDMPAILAILAVVFSLVVIPLIMRLEGNSGRRSLHADLRTYSWFAVVVLAPVFNLFALVLVIGFVYWLWEWPPFERGWTRTLTWCVAWLAAWFAIWTSVYWLVQDIGPADRSLREFVRVLFFYPDLYSEVLYRWARSLPLTSIMLFGSIGAGILLRKTGRWSNGHSELFVYLSGLIVMLCLLVAILPQPYATIRYTFFLYPALIIAAASAWIGIVELVAAGSRKRAGITLSLVTVTFLVVSEDVNPAYAWNITTPDTLYRTNFSKWETDLVYRRWDYKSPALFVNENVAEDDEIITTMQSVPFYLNRLDYFYRDESSGEFFAIAACGARRELWSNAKLVYKEEKLEQLVVNRSNGMWLIFRSPGQDEAWPVEAAIGRRNANNERFVSADGRISIYYLSAPDSAQKSNKSALDQ